MKTKYPVPSPSTAFRREPYPPPAAVPGNKVVNFYELAKTCDRLAAACTVPLLPERGSLVSFLFHGLLRDDHELALNQVDPQQKTTVQYLRDFVRHFLTLGYRFVAPPDIAAGLDPNGRYALLTFDDGYFNHTRALPVLQEFQVPAVFFITTGNVQTGDCFWWDVVVRKRTEANVPGHAIWQELNRLKLLPVPEIRAALRREFGPDALRPRGELDRPMTPDELKAFAADPLVYLGNHSENHAILTQCTPSEVREEVAIAQDRLQSWTGAAPTMIAYPNGDVNPNIIRTCRDEGLSLGITTDPWQQRLPISHDDLMLISRFTPDGKVSVPAEARLCRSRFVLHGRLRRIVVDRRRRDRADLRLAPQS